MKKEPEYKVGETVIYGTGKFVISAIAFYATYSYLIEFPTGFEPSDQMLSIIISGNVDKNKKYMLLQETNIFLKKAHYFEKQDNELLLLLC